MTNWAAPRASAPVHAVVEVPGSKSLTNRVLILSALAAGPSRITGPLRARDTVLMADALRALGVRIDDDGDDWVVTPAALHGADVDTGLAGTVMRFVPPVAALAHGKVRFDGDEYARERPMTTLLDGMRQVGIEVDDESRGSLPFTVIGAGSVPGGVVSIDASASSQFVSGLLLAAARFQAGAEVRHSGPGSVPSMPHIEMTIDVLRTAGVTVSSPRPGVWQVAPGVIEGRDWIVEPDLSNAASFLAAALVTGGAVTIPRWPTHTTQAGDQLRELLGSMGADVRLTEAGLTVSAGAGLHGLVADLHDVGELTPTLVALAALADSPSRLTGIGHLRGHETDRLAALKTELSGLGGTITADDDGLSITPAPLHAGVWHSYADHRMATAGAVLGLAVDGIEVQDVESTTKTLPDFTGMWHAMIGHGA